MDNKPERSVIQTSFSWLRNLTTPKPDKGDPFDIFCVVADDEKYFQRQILNELNLIIQKRPDVRVGVAAADNAEALFSLAFAGNAGLPATMLLLDLAFEHEKYLWRTHAGDIIHWMKKLNISFPITTTGRSIPLDILEQCFDHYGADGEIVALALRAAGFSGNIKILSNNSAGDENSWSLNHRLNGIRELIPDLKIQTPIINERLRKQGFSGESFIPYPTQPLLPTKTRGRKKGY